MLAFPHMCPKLKPEQVDTEQLLVPTKRAGRAIRQCAAMATTRQFSTKPGKVTKSSFRRRKTNNLVHFRLRLEGWAEGETLFKVLVGTELMRALHRDKQSSSLKAHTANYLLIIVV